MKKIKISWSSFDLWRLCPQAYNLFYLEEKGFTLDEKQDRFYAIIGSVIQEVFSRFYNDQLWRMKKNVIPYLTDTLLPQVWPFVLDSFTVNWEDHDKSEKDLFNEAKEMIPKITKLLLNKKLLFPNGLQRAEVKHMLPFDEENGIYLMGKFDFLFKDSEVIILDGKATHNVKDDQLYFYSYLYELINGELPDKIGYIYYDTAEVIYIKFSAKKYNKLKNEIDKLVQAINEGDFLAKPELNKCEACILKQICSKKELTNATA